MSSTITKSVWKIEKIEVRINYLRRFGNRLDRQTSNSTTSHLGTDWTDKHQTSLPVMRETIKLSDMILGKQIKN